MQSGPHSRRCTQVFHLNHLLASPPVLTQGFSILSNYLCSPHTEASFSGIGLEGKIYTQNRVSLINWSQKIIRTTLFHTVELQ